MAKRGRPPTTIQLTPPGMKWCNYQKHFAPLIDFKGKDGYCRGCRKLYTRRYRKDKERHEMRADIYGIEVDVYCNKCGEQFAIYVDKEQETGTWTCPHCDNEWTGTIKARLRS